LPLWDATPKHDERPVLVVQTPGFARDAFLPLVEALRKARADVRVASFGCGAEDGASIASEIRTAAADLGPDVIVVAHGVGATLALRSGAEPAGWVLLAPVVGVWPTEALTAAASLPIGPAVDLTAPRDWNGADLRAVLLGDPLPALECAPAALVTEVQAWVRDGAVPIDLEAVHGPVWVGMSLGDDVAAVEALAEPLRRLPHVTVERLGRNGFDPEDYDHARLLDDRRPIRAAVRAVRKTRR